MFKRYWQIFPLTITLCLLLGLLAVGILTLLQPKVYEASTTIQVRPRAISMEVPNGTTIRPEGAISPTFFPTEFEVIKAQKTLDIVIDELDLLTRWNPDRDIVRQQLDENIHVQNIKGTDLIEIRVHAASPEEARDIAVTLSEAYRARRTELEAQRTEQALEELRDAVKKQEATVEDKRKTLTIIIRNQELLERSGKTAKQLESEEFFKLHERKPMLESQIENLQRFKGDQLMTYAAGLQLPENTICVLHPQYLEAKRALAALDQGGLGPDHPNVKQQKEVIESMRRNLDEGVVALRESLKAQLELTKEKIEHFRANRMSCPIGRPGLEDAKVEFETAQRLLEQLKIKLVGEEMQRRISESPIIIHAEPILTEKPVYPNLLRNLTIGLLSGIALGIISPFLITPFLNRQP